MRPNPMSVDLKKLDFAPGRPVRKLTLTKESALLVNGSFVSGEVSQHFQPAQAFLFAGTAR